MKQLPQQLPLPRMQTVWASALNPVISNLIVQGTLLEEIKLVSGSNVVNHMLGKPLTGWFITRMRGTFVEVYDTQDTNPNPSLTLLLNASTGCVVDLYCF